MKLKIILVVIIFLSFPILAFTQDESITITTYYPSPYGSYNELATNVFQLKPQNTAPTGAPSELKGKLYFDNNDNTLKYHDGNTWVTLASSGLELGTAEQIGVYELTVVDWRSIGPSWTTPQPYFTNPYNNVIRVNLSTFGTGLYLIEWEGTIEIDGPDDFNKYARLRLQSGEAGVAWSVIDASDKFYDTNSPGQDGFFTTIKMDTRSVTQLLSKRTLRDFRVQVYKSIAGMSVRVKDFKVTVTRLTSF